MCNGNEGCNKSDLRIPLNIPIYTATARRTHLPPLASTTIYPQVMWTFSALVATILFTTVHSLSTSCSAPLGAGLEAPDYPY